MTATARTHTSIESATEQFRNAMQKHGLTPPENIIADGIIHRFASDGRDGDDAGWYVFYDGDIRAGAFGCWRLDIKEKWRENIGRPFTAAEETAYKKWQQAIRQAQEQEKKARYAEANAKAENILSNAPLADDSHPYLQSKKVKSYGLHIHDGDLVVSAGDISGEVRTLQFISADGDKRFLSGGQVKGCFHLIGKPDGVLCIAEGYATAATIYEATGYVVAVAFNAGNLQAVVEAFRQKYPDMCIIIAADDDRWKPDIGNPGKEKAEEAAKQFGCTVALPVFKDTTTKPTDFNDLHCLEGLEVVKAQLLAVEKEQPDTSANETLNRKFKVKNNGVFFHGHDRDGKELPPQWICSALRITAKTRDAKSGEWGRLLEWNDDDTVAHRWAMPLELLQGDGSDVRRELARSGLSIAPGKSARDRLAEYLQVWPVEHRARCVERLGWHGDVYVTPGETVGEAGEIVVFQNAHALEPALSVAGTIEEWRTHVASLAAGNSRLVFAISISFAATLVDVAGEDSGGFHFRGGSSIGKTKALNAAASVWGNPPAYSRLWRATANGLEGLAALHNDGLLILDELNQIDPREAGESAYLLANGQGKARASRSGTARQSARWRLLFLSAGEESLTALMARAGKRATAGQEIRLADIPADAGAGMGAFETLNGQPTAAALALAVKDAASRYHGAVGLEWLCRIVTNRAMLPDFLSDGIKQFLNEAVPKDAAGQVGRVARRFALVAVAGELATHYGLTGWQEGEAIKAARKCFDAWLESFGGTGNREERAMLAQVRAFFEAHGSSRFEDMEGKSDQRIPNRAGFQRTGAEGKLFIVLSEIYQREVCAGYDAKAVTRALLAKGWLAPGGDGRPTRKLRLPGLGTPRCYVFTTCMWEDGE